MRPKLLRLAAGTALLAACSPALRAPAGAARGPAPDSGRDLASSRPEAPAVPSAVASPAPADTPVSALPPADTVVANRIAFALGTLAPLVREQSDPDALRDAVRAYFNFRAVHPDRLHNPFLYFVDYGLGNRTPRGYVFDMELLTVVEGPFAVAQGRGSSNGSDGVPTRFSNAPGSDASSLGLFLTGESYPFTGTADGRRYHALGLRLTGLSGRFNDAAGPRRVVVHGAPYVTATRAGRSEGCPAMSIGLARRLIPLIADGGLVFLFSPRDSDWVRHDPWVHGAGVRMAAN